MPAGNKNPSTENPLKLKQYAASASVRDLVADSPDGKTCARALLLLGAAGATGSFTSAKDWTDTLMPGTVAGTLGPLPAGKELLGNFSSVISVDQAFIAFW